MSEKQKVLLNALLISILLINVFVLLFRFKLSTVLKDVLLKSEESSIYLVIGIDKLLDQLNPAGNLFVKFIGFSDKKDERDWGTAQDAVSIIYFRMAFYLYPRFVFAGPEDLKIVRGTEFLEFEFSPESSWFCKNKITDTLVFIRDEEGRIRVEKRNFNEKLK